MGRRVACGDHQGLGTTGGGDPWDRPVDRPSARVGTRRYDGLMKVLSTGRQVADAHGDPMLGICVQGKVFRCGRIGGCLYPTQGSLALREDKGVCQRVVSYPGVEMEVFGGRSAHRILVLCKSFENSEPISKAVWASTEVLDQGSESWPFGNQLVK